jgi:hypothetical protein
MKKELLKSKDEKVKNHAELMRSLNAKMDKWKRMENGDIKALIELSVEHGLATKEDFPSYFIASNARARPPSYDGEVYGFGQLLDD